ncbi:GGDEF domain-containing protein [Anaerovorax odorimutans]|uniref:GGDEF domain-containing protein n=1 Tax=Anaerovorax odorimutans TaxID=109327 RepID=A0ABT1RN98_9FIRM|nr:GGDEF domain-containing protein [Anaerovorax odorimutans]MCQ4636645.1 GGDEF domain-containing protein [Anaerovorax odorimutans]
MAAIALLGPPLPISLFVLGCLYYLSAVLSGRGRIYEAKLIGLISFLLFSSLLLMLIGAVSLVGQITIREICESFNIRTGLLLCINCIMSGAVLIGRPLLQLEFLELEHDRKQDNLFFGFLWCGLIYVLTDSVFCLLDIGPVVAILLIAGNVLLNCLIFLFFRQKWMIARARKLEEERIELAAERAREKIRKERLRKTLERDSLTGCFSRRYAVNYLQKLQKKQQLFSVVFIDLDGLKKVNDEQGHQEGDRMLLRFAEEMRARLNKEELLARIGGDEFLLIQPDIGLQASEKRMADLRAAISELEQPIFFSYGAACGGEDIETLIEEADLAMYRDKGRMKEGGDDK